MAWSCARALPLACILVFSSAQGAGADSAPASGPASASSSDAPKALPPVTVPLPPPAPAQTPESPTRRDPTAAVTVIDVAPLRGEARVASEVIATAPGVVLHQRGGPLQTSQLSLRGAASTGVLVLLDGVPINGAGGLVDLSRIPLPLVERVEVLRGGGARHAPGGIGGVVNLVTRTPEGGSVRTAGGVTAGSFGTATAHLSATSDVLGGQGLLLLHGARSDGQFPFLHDPTPTLDDGRFDERLRRNNDAQLAGGMLRYRRALNGGFPSGSLVDVSAEAAVDARGLAGPAQNPSEDMRMSARRVNASTRMLVPLELGELSVRGWLRQDETSMRGGLFGLEHPQRERSFGLDAEGSLLVGGTHGLSAVAQVAGDTLSAPGENDPSWARAGVGIADEWLLFEGRASLVPSIRADVTGPFFTLSPKLGARVELPWSFELSANAGQAHRPPSFAELYVMQGTLLPNPQLRPERALFADGTLTHRTSRTRVALTAFHTLYEDLIAYEYYPPLLAKPYNFSAALAQGLEAEAEVRLHRFARATASYTLMRTQNLRDDPRYFLRELPYRPRHRLHARVTGGPEWLQLRAEADVQSRQFTNRTNRQELPARAFIHLGATARVWKAPDLRLGVDVKNVLDSRAQDFDGYPLPGRALFATVSFALERARAGTGTGGPDAEIQQQGTEGEVQ